MVIYYSSNAVPWDHHQKRREEYRTGQREEWAVIPSLQRPWLVPRELWSWG